MSSIADVHDHFVTQRDNQGILFTVSQLLKGGLPLSILMQELNNDGYAAKVKLFFPLGQLQFCTESVRQTILPLQLEVTGAVQALRSSATPQDQAIAMAYVQSAMETRNTALAHLAANFQKNDRHTVTWFLRCRWVVEKLSR